MITDDYSLEIDKIYKHIITFNIYHRKKFNPKDFYVDNINSEFFLSDIYTLFYGNIIFFD